MSTFLMHVVIMWLSCDHITWFECSYLHVMWCVCCYSHGWMLHYKCALLGCGKESCDCIYIAVHGRLLFFFLLLPLTLFFPLSAVWCLPLLSAVPSSHKEGIPMRCAANDLCKYCCASSCTLPLSSSIPVSSLEPHLRESLSQTRPELTRVYYNKGL